MDKTKHTELSEGKFLKAITYSIWDDDDDDDDDDGDGGGGGGGGGGDVRSQIT
jgi:hypothetical protein